MYISLKTFIVNESCWSFRGSSVFKYRGLALQIHKKKMHEIEQTSVENIRKQQQLQWIAHIIWSDYNEIIKMWMVHTLSNNRLGKKTARHK